MQDLLSYDDEEAINHVEREWLYKTILKYVQPESGFKEWLMTVSKKEIFRDVLGTQLEKLLEGNDDAVRDARKKMDDSSPDPGKDSEEIEMLEQALRTYYHNTVFTKSCSCKRNHTHRYQ